MIRNFLLWMHRWIGLLIAGFLVIAGVTGSILAFDDELEHAINPQLFAPPRPSSARLDLATLADRAAALDPRAQVRSVRVSDWHQASISVAPRQDPATGRPYQLGFDQLFLDPWTGAELGRRTRGDISQGLVSLVPFIDKLHYELSLGRIGMWVLGMVALAWTVDCFVGLYLTLPLGVHAFCRRWQRAWLVKPRAGIFRLSFDLHRAGGLWLWPMLLVLAWSSVYMNLHDTVYTWVTRAALDYRPAWTELATLPRPISTPRLDFRAALATGERLMREQAVQHGFSVERPIGLHYQPGRGAYGYTVRSSLDIKDKGAGTVVYFDGESGAPRLTSLPTGHIPGNTVTSWLAALHTADLLGLPYRAFVCALGLLIAMLSAIGVYIWWRKRRARKLAVARERLPMPCEAGRFDALRPPAPSH